jgi:SAM-dependent methyltransferase
MKHLPDKVRWHIKEREKTSKEEAVYISQVIDFFRKKLNEKYSSILDVACGNGRLHPYLRKFGFEVFGIDSSKELIKEAQRPYCFEKHKQTLARKRIASLRYTKRFRKNKRNSIASNFYVKTRKFS